MIVLVVDATLVAVLVAGLLNGDTHWYNYLQLPLWVWLTVNFGWLMPKSVDDWHRQELGSPDSEGG